MAYAYFPIPGSLKREHEELLAELSRASREGGRLGRAADIALSIIVPHMQREEEFALPPLALLRDLADGAISEEMDPILLLIDRFRRWLPEMFSDHREIARVMRDLEVAAMDDRKPEFARISSKVQHHLEMEEEVIYPASLLVGEYLGLTL